MPEIFLMIDVDGQKIDKQGFINTITNPDLVIEPYVLEDWHIRIYDNSAIITAANKMQGTYQTHPFTRYYRYTDIYVKEGDVWRVAGVQATSIK